MVTVENWAHDYTRESAAFPVASLKRHKYWPPVGRIDNAYGDRNIMCSCVPMSAFADNASEAATAGAASAE
jgi:glycine dehydrogenase